MLYFAYGSNMNTEQIVKRCPSATYITVAVIRDYKFVFNKKSDKKGGSVKANITPHDGEVVYGIIFEINDNDFLNLSRIEDNYGIINIKAFDSGNKEYEVSVFISTHITDDLPFHNYKNLIVKAVRDNKLPREYLDMLENFNSKKLA